MADGKPIHGTKGVYCGGQWIDIEDCGKWLSAGPKGCGAVDRRANAKEMREKRRGDAPEDSFDVIIIGGGCVGGAVARELAKLDCSVLLLERDDDVTQGATKGNSGIVHSGYDDKPGSVRSKHCWPGNQMFAALDKDLKFGYIKNGSLVVAKGPKEEQVLDELIMRGKQNKVQHMRIVRGAELKAIEPHLHPDVTAALYSPEAGTVTPYEFAIALCENAADNGVDVRIRHEVTNLKKESDGSFTVTARNWDPALKPSGAHGSIGINGLKGVLALLAVGVLAVAVELMKTLQSGVNIAQGEFRLAGLAAVDVFLLIALVAIVVLVVQLSQRGNSGATVKKGAIHTTLSFEAGNVGRPKEFKGKFVINAAGLFADKIANMVGDESFTIKPRLGDYLLMHKNQGHLARTTIFPCPDPVLGKGVLVQQTLWGNLILGPTARDTYLPEKLNIRNDEVISFILRKCSELVPGIKPADIIHTFCGARAKSSRGDWIIEESKAAKGFILAAGIDSPGLAGSPSIAIEVMRLLKSAGLKAGNNPYFNPVRRPLIVPKNLWKGPKGERLKLYKEGVKDAPPPDQHIICKCEKVTEQEIIDAVRSSLDVDNTQAIRRRTRAGMGHCQGGEFPHCEQRVAEVIAREKNIKTADVGRRPWPATSLLPQRWLTDDQKKWFVSLAGK